MRCGAVVVTVMAQLIAVGTFVVAVIVVVTVFYRQLLDLPVAFFQRIEYFVRSLLEKKGDESKDGHSAESHIKENQIEVKGEHEAILP